MARRASQVVSTMIVYRAPAKIRKPLTPKQEARAEKRAWKQVLKDHRCNVPHNYEVANLTHGTIWWCDYCESYWKYTGNFIPPIFKPMKKRTHGWDKISDRAAKRKINHER